MKILPARWRCVRISWLEYRGDKSRGDAHGIPSFCLVQVAFFDVIGVVEDVLVGVVVQRALRLKRDVRCDEFTVLVGMEARACWNELADNHVFLSGRRGYRLYPQLLHRPTL